MLKSLKLFYFILFIISTPALLLCQKTSSTYISSNLLENHDEIVLRNNWKFKSGDDNSWRSENYNDSAWLTTDTRLIDENFADEFWNGIGWFRLHIDIDSNDINKNYGLVIWQTGALEIYLNGNKISQIGIVGDRESEYDSLKSSPILIQFPKTKNNVIAVRYSNYNSSLAYNLNNYPGFNINIGNYENLQKKMSQYSLNTLHFRTFFMSVSLTLALLHLFLFIFNRKQKQNLYYTLFLAAFSIFIYSIYLNLSYPAFHSRLLYRGIMILSLNITLLFGSTTIYSIYKPVPKYFPLIILFALIISIPAFLNIGSEVWYISYIFITTISIIGSIPLFNAQNKGLEDRLLQIGFGVMAFGGIYQMLLSFGLLPSLFGSYNPYLYGVLVFIFFMSISLAYTYAFTSKKLIVQLENVKELSKKTLQQELEAKELENQRKLLEAENNRKTIELNDARKLQLSMLPSKLPNFPNLDIGVFIETATEVGGDYYDFKITKDNNLNVVLGDATGHGMKAGLMVTTIKSLFTAMGESLILTDFFQKCTSTIKELKLGNLFMSLIFLRIKNDQILFVSAGMPPIFYFNQSTQKIEQITTKSMPLGAVKNFPYELKQINILPGDAVILMTDGIIERFNNDKEILGTEKIQMLLEKIAESHTADEIIKKLIELSNSWSDGRPLDDDTTIVVLKRNLTNP